MADAAGDGVREFSTDLSLYEKGRPEYSEESAEFLLNRVGALPSDRREAIKLLEIAAGTGKFTRVMAKVLAAKRANVEIIASDSQKAMCDMFRRFVTGIEMLHFPAENIALPDESVPVIICAQSFHWFASEKSVGEICRVLKPGGKYGMIWNHRDHSVPWVRAMQDIVDPFVKQKDMPPDPRELTWKESLDNSGKFTSVERDTSFQTYLEGDIDNIVSVIMCISAISQSSKEKRAMVESKIRDILTNHPDLRGTQVYKLPYITDICWCTKKQVTKRF
ncbi:hypothetical protein OS493_017935 [Desmophyllum pertusum]|uniref:Methyltransferase type 11 domain-containing protein n=1 Tax=Desmophyllum pertusum TaxID=174260 RepID=A0A9W9YZT5_9CNID|nr:hypothetical protein OS493_017935 [Desmophyllum pertusum]